MLGLWAAAVVGLAGFARADAVFRGYDKDQNIVPPEGNYKVVELVFEQSSFGDPELLNPKYVKAAFRDGKLKFIRKNDWNAYTSELTVTADSIKGTFVWIPAYDEYRFDISATIKDGVVDGSWTLVKKPDTPNAWLGAPRGALTGVVRTEAELARANALPNGADWAQYNGPSCAMAATPTGVSLVTDPDDVRFVWRSEEFTAGGQGNSGQYGNVLDSSSMQGGGASPVVSTDGKVYVNYF
jgi:hypothetical protein